jgi:tungstate transport system substrate-binding protein
VLLVHARAQEEAFVKSGYGIIRRDVMHNQFLVDGPKNDPAKIKGEKSVVVAFKKISSKQARFISRGDNSGTIPRSGVFGRRQVSPGGKWYIEAGQGMGIP